MVVLGTGLEWINKQVIVGPVYAVEQQFVISNNDHLLINISVITIVLIKR